MQILQIAWIVGAICSKIHHEAVKSQKSDREGAACVFQMISMEGAKPSLDRESKRHLDLSRT